MTNKPKAINFSEKQLEMVEAIKTKLGYNTFTQVIHYCLVQTFKDEFKDYVQKTGRGMSPEERVQYEKKMKDEKKKIEQEGKRKIAEALDGTIFEKDGELYCKYVRSTKTADYPQTLKLDQLTEELIKAQYSPSKADVLRYREGVKNGTIKPIQQQ